MPWRGPEFDGEFPSLGWDVLDWAERYFRVPDGPLAGEPLTLTDEQARILVRFYQLDDRGRFVYRRAAVRRAKGWGKSPLLAVVALAELCGPSRFERWDDNGDVVGTRPVAPWVQVAAVSEDQTDNTYSALYEMASGSELAGTLLDVGLTRVFLNDGTGRLEPVTAAAGSREGQRVTFAVLDETHLWYRRNGGQKLAATIRRNAGKMNGRTFESTNAHVPGEDSVAEHTAKAAEAGHAGLLYDSVEAPQVDDLSDREAVAAALKIAYGDAHWAPLDRLAAEIADPSTDPDDARRFYFNQATTSSKRIVDIRFWETDRARPARMLEPGTRVGLGFDGSISDDSTVLYAATRDLHVVEFAVWERPHGAPAGWTVPRLEVHDAVWEAFEVYDVGLMLCDPPLWRTEIEGWAERYRAVDENGKDVERVVMLDTNQARRFAPACDRFATGVRQRAVTHDGNPTLTLHLAAAVKKFVRISDDEDDGRSKFVIVKEDVRKIDAAVGAVLAVEAAATMPEAVVKPTPAWGGDAARAAKADLGVFRPKQRLKV